MGEEEDPIDRLSARVAGLEEKVAGLEERIIKLETDMEWVKKVLARVDLRTWVILASVIIGILVALLR